MNSHNLVLRTWLKEKVSPHQTLRSSTRTFTNSFVASVLLSGILFVAYSGQHTVQHGVGKQITEMRTAVITLLAALSVHAAPDYYPFHIDQDSLAGAVDFSFLNHTLTPADRLFRCGSHFCRLGADLKAYTSDDERVRLFGTNLSFAANFPAEEDGVRVARRLRRLGFNLVRLHHMDTEPSSDPNRPESILTNGPFPTLHTQSVGRLRKFLNALSAEGIYVNLNLHVGYTFRPTIDRVPSPWESNAFPLQSKPLQMILPQLVELQQQFARQVLEGLQLKDDPVLGMVEINNESSLLHSWQTQELDWYMSGAYQTEWSRQWNDFLRSRYTSTNSLRDKWGASSSNGPNLLTGEWLLELHYPSEAALEQADGSIAVNVKRGGAPVIAKQVGFSLQPDRLYAVEVELRADLPDSGTRTVYWDIKQDDAPWRTQTGSYLEVSNTWQQFRMAFHPTFAMDRNGRMGLSVEKLDAPISIRNCRIVELGKQSLGDNESLEARTIRVPNALEATTEARANDYLTFLVSRDRAYLNSIQATVREAAGPLVPIAGTQVGYGGVLNYDSHDGMDFHDNHFYVDHYLFPHNAWDWADWGIRDTSSVESGMPEFLNMAFSRLAGTPYTISEFNQPWPNRHAAELNPSLAAFGAFQDWDGLVQFAYSHGQNWDDTFPRAFDLNGDWTKVPGIGQSAWLFRTGAIRTGDSPVDIPLSLGDRLRASRERWNGRVSEFFQEAVAVSPMTALQHPVRVVKDGSGPAPTEAGPSGGKVTADTGEFSYDPAARVFRIHADRVAGISGFVENKRLDGGGSIDVEVVSDETKFVSLLLTPLDGKTISESHHLLLSLPGHTFRSQPGEEPARPQKMIKYPNIEDWWTLEPDQPDKPSGTVNAGRGPVWVERVESYFTFRTNVSGLKVYPLDGNGRRFDPLNEEDNKAVDGGYRIHLQANGQAWSPWYELTLE